MKKFLLFACILFAAAAAACGKSEHRTEVYTITGENEDIAIQNGLLVSTDQEEKFIGGGLIFKNEPLTGVKDYTESFFYYKDGEKEIILRSGSSFSGAPDGQTITEELGSIASEELFYGDDLQLVKDSLQFAIEGTLMNGESFSYILNLDVEQVF